MKGRSRGEGRGGKKEFENRGEETQVSPRRKKLREKMRGVQKPWQCVLAEWMTDNRIIQWRKRGSTGRKVEETE